MGTQVIDKSPLIRSIAFGGRAQEYLVFAHGPFLLLGLRDKKVPYTVCILLADHGVKSVIYTTFNIFYGNNNTRNSYI